MPLCTAAHRSKTAEDGIVDGRGSRWCERDVIRVDSAVVSIRSKAVQEETLIRPVQPSIQVDILLRCMVEEMLSAAAAIESSVAAIMTTR